MVFYTADLANTEVKLKNYVDYLLKVGPIKRVNIKANQSDLMVD